MPDNMPKPNDRKLSWIGPLTIVAILGVILLGVWLLEGRAPPAPTAAPAPPAPPPSAAEPPKVGPPPAMTRAELVDLANLYADAYAAGRPPERATPAAVGRRFSLQIPFGCEGLQAADPAAQAMVEYDPARRVLRLSARPADWSALPQFRDGGTSDAVESVEGFWAPRPWLRSDACPPKSTAAPAATPTPAAAPTLGLAQIFRTEDSRVGRRDSRAYDVTRPAPEDQPGLLSRSYRLVLEGRIVGFEDGAPIRCWAESANHRPICIYAVVFDRVAIRDASEDAPLAEWRG